jgi:hypothetical protein
MIGKYVQARANQFGCNMTKVLYTIVDYNVFKVTCFWNIMNFFFFLEEMIHILKV